MSRIGKDYRTGRPIGSNGTDSLSTPSGGEDWLAPALFDLQINGCDGISFNSDHLQVDGVRRVVEVCRSHGIGQFFPTLITQSFEGILHGFQTLTRAREQDPLTRRTIPGYHLEGPYLSPEEGPRGAHPKTHIRPPDFDEFARWQEAADGLIRLVTLSPEYPESLPFIERLTRMGVVVAIGHTSASPQQIRDAAGAGARLSTHLGNGCHAMLPRHESYLWEQLACDDLWASFIPDGHHLPVSFLKCLTRTKGWQRLILTCDASSLAGCPPGRYAHWDTELEVVPSGKIVVPGTPFLAGSGSFTDACVSQLIKMIGCTLAEAIDAATVMPRTLLGLPPGREWIRFHWQPGAMLEVREIFEVTDDEIGSSFSESHR
jgi:N-acetylglucosamine-6-phosphate deacetylase